MKTDHARDSATILGYWFATLDDASRLDRAEEPFRTCYQRWYGKEPAIDADISSRFEPLLVETTRDGRRMNDVIAGFRQAPRGLLALVILLDQLAVMLEAIRAHEGDEVVIWEQPVFSNSCGAQKVCGVSPEAGTGIHDRVTLVSNPDSNVDISLPP